MQNNSEKKIDRYLDHLEFLSSKIADNISMGLFQDINKMDYERKAIINKISSDTANLNHTRRNRLKLVWINNNKMINRTIGMTPEQATDPKNEAHVRAMLEINAIRKRKYPDIKIGDRVKIYKKKKVFDKERISVWTELSYEVEDIKDEKGQEFYYLSGHYRPLLRHEILKVRAGT